MTSSGFAPQLLTEDGAWCWFSDPRGVYYHGQREQTYLGWMDSAGSVMIGAYDHATDTLQTHCLHHELEIDDHDNPAILIRPDGHLLVFYSLHSGTPQYLVQSTNPEDITAWESVREINLNDPATYEPGLLDRYCYANPCQLSQENGRIYLFWRGLSHKPNWSASDDGGQTWSPGRIVVQPEQTYRNQRPYMKVSTNHRDRIHLAFTYGHPRNEPENSIFYVCYRQGAFFRADGSLICAVDALPLSPYNTDVVYDARPSQVRAWVWDVASDAAGNPVIVYSRIPDVTDHRYHYARFDGQRWHDVELTAAGKWFPQTIPGTVERETEYSGGLALNHSDPNIVYLSRPVNGVFEIERWTTADSGQSWQQEAVTCNSRYDQVRPFVVRHSRPGHGPHLVWMENRRYIHFTDYETALKWR